MRDIPWLRRRRRALPRLPVLLIVIPFASGGRAVLVHQQTRTHAHAAIIGLHQPALGILLEMRGHPATAVEEVLRAHAGRDQPAVLSESAEVLVESIFVRLLVFEARGLGLLEDLLQVVGEVLAVILIAQAEGADLMPLLGQQLRHPAHPREDCDDLLGMMHHVVRLGPYLHEHVRHRCVFLAEPGMLRVQLIAEDKTDGGGHARKGGRTRRMANEALR